MSEATVAPVAAPKSMGSATPSSRGEISVSQMSARSSANPGKQVSPVTPPPPGSESVKPATPSPKSASQRMEEDLMSRSRQSNQPPEAKKTKQEAPSDSKIDGLDDDFQEPVDGESPPEEVKPAEAQPQAATDKKKVNPWKLAEEHKVARAKLEAEIAEIKKLGFDPESRKAELARMEEITRRSKELEDHIKFVDFTKSSEFVEKYQKPYEQKWQQAMSELKEITVQDPQSGEERQMQPVDLLKIVNMPLRDAQEACEELYGSLAPTVMGYRREIRALNESQNSAVVKAKEESQRVHQENSSKMESLRGHVSKTWEEVNKAIIDNPKVGELFKSKDGDEEINKVLESGYKLVDDVMAQNAFDPRFTDEQRKNVIERHAAVRARAAGFGRVRLELSRERAAHKKTLEKLRQYEKSTPDFTNQEKEVADSASPVKASSFMEQQLRKLAK